MSEATIGGGDCCRDRAPERESGRDAGLLRPHGAQVLPSSTRVFRGGIPEALEAFIAIHPEAGALVVDSEALCRDESGWRPQERRSSILCGKIKSGL